MSHQMGYEKGEKGSFISALTNGVLFIFKMFAGVVGNSNAMIADALDTLGDVMTSTGMIVGFKIAKQPPDAHHPYGHGRAESIIAKLLAIFLLLLGIKVACNSVTAIYEAIAHGRTYVPQQIAMIAAIVSIVVKLGLFQYLTILNRTLSSTSIAVYSWNIASDVFSSFVALIGIAGARLGMPLLDPIAALILSVLIIRIGVEAFHRAYDELMDAAPSKEVMNAIRKTTLFNKNVKAIKDVKVRKMGLELIIDMTIDLDKSISIEKGHAITDQVTKDILNKIPAAKEVFIHVEPFKGKR
ncbi:MAG: cation diffusion facilitator family transporter [Candidatus Omnitrophica bacterium]|nr:cation diffusion facilitator family transporter [Candidatus Omnitrophota bacterium]MBU4488308.1 cation diffusion facilitator family transporter [Candidatus Omnitrophota bacterium]